MYTGIASSFQVETAVKPSKGCWVQVELVFQTVGRRVSQLERYYKLYVISGTHLFRSCVQISPCGSREVCCQYLWDKCICPPLLTSAVLFSKRRERRLNLSKKRNTGSYCSLSCSLLHRRFTLLQQEVERHNASCKYLFLSSIKLLNNARKSFDIFSCIYPPLYSDLT